MATRLRKVRRLRGSRTHGWGQIGQHRRTGAKGGSGMAGLHKHKWSYTVKYAPDHFGSNKWQPPNRTVIRRWINLNQLESMVKGDEVDLSSLGYEKLLGQGSVKRALKVKVERASGSAIEKIKSAGGSVELLLKRETDDSDSKTHETSKAPIQKR